MPERARPELSPEEEEQRQARRTVLRWFTYGLYCVTSAAGDETGAFTANWLSQASFEPPMVMISVEADSHSLPVIRASGRFAINVFASGQRELAGHFGKKTRHAGNKLEGIDYHLDHFGQPIIDEALGYVICETAGELPAGDSVVLVANVVEAVVLASPDRAGLTMAEAGFRHAG